MVLPENGDFLQVAPSGNCGVEFLSPLLISRLGAGGKQKRALAHKGPKGPLVKIGKIGKGYP